MTKSSRQLLCGTLFLALLAALLWAPTGAFAANATIDVNVVNHTSYPIAYTITGVWESSGEVASFNTAPLGQTFAPDESRNRTFTLHLAYAHERGADVSFGFVNFTQDKDQIFEVEISGCENQVPFWWKVTTSRVHQTSESELGFNVIVTPVGAGIEPPQ